MKKILTLAAFTGLALTAQATITTSKIAVGSSTDFPTTSISGANGTRSFSTVVASPAGGTIAGGQAQGGFATGVAWGEVFNWTGSANGNTLSAFSIIVNGASATGGTYQPFLFDIGTSLFNTGASTFNPSLQTDLLSGITLNIPGISSANFLEFDLAGSDAVTLTVGHSYAFGLLNVTAVAGDINFVRDSGTQADPNGAPFQIASGGLTGTSATVPGFGAGPRNLMIGVYTTTPVPEPSTFALLGGALALFGVIRRTRK